MEYWNTEMLGFSKGKGSFGFTLLELLISTVILSILMIGLYQSLSTALSAYDSTRNTQDLLSQARFTIERMALFVQETDYISKPDDVNQEILKVSERLMDTYNNSSHAYAVDGDGRPDADNDSDGLVNEDALDTGGADPYEFITFDLDKSDATNWKLREQAPDYGTSTLGDLKGYAVICEHVKLFRCSRLSMGGSMVEIVLALDNGTSGVTLTTRSRARLLE